MVNIEYAYSKLYQVRYFEQFILELFSQGKVSGTTHTYSGQEAIGFSTLDSLENEDFVFSNHRCHGHFIFKEKNIKGLMAEILGLESGVSKGKGGSQHLKFNNFYSSGIQGGYASICIGIAKSIKYFKKQNIVVCFLGDGTFGEGAIYEAFNAAALYTLPIIFVVENNFYAQTTHVSKNLSGSITKRVESFGIETMEFSSNNLFEIYEPTFEIIKKMKLKSSPFCLVYNTYRLSAHSKGDDFRTKVEIDSWKKKDPLIYLEKELSRSTVLNIKNNEEKLINTIYEELMMHQSK